MKLNIIDDKIHKVNDDLNYEVTRIENHPIITIDNVLANPYDFLENVVQKVPMQFNNMEVEDEVFPGYQSRLRPNFPELAYLTGHFIQKCTDFTNIDPIKSPPINPGPHVALYKSILLGDN